MKKNLIYCSGALGLAFPLLILIFQYFFPNIAYKFFKFFFLLWPSMILNLPTATGSGYDLTLAISIGINGVIYIFIAWGLHVGAKKPIILAVTLFAVVSILALLLRI